VWTTPPDPISTLYRTRNVNWSLKWSHVKACSPTSVVGYVRYSGTRTSAPNSCGRQGLTSPSFKSLLGYAARSSNRSRSSLHASPTPAAMIAVTASATVLNVRQRGWCRRNSQGCGETRNTLLPAASAAPDPLPKTNQDPIVRAEKLMSSDPSKRRQSPPYEFLGVGRQFEGRSARFQNNSDLAQGPQGVVREEFGSD
jgi:hypothetical protein